MGFVLYLLGLTARTLVAKADYLKIEALLEDCIHLVFFYVSLF